MYTIILCKQTRKIAKNVNFFNTLYIKTTYDHNSKCAIVTASKHDILQKGRNI